MLIVNEHLSIPEKELEFTFSRSPGPGGQNVNKVNSKATLSWALSESAALPPAVLHRLRQQQRHRITKDGRLQLSSHRFRDQARNIDDCLERLRTMIVAALMPPKNRKKTAPSRASQRRRLDNKRKKSEKKSSRSTSYFE